MSSSEILSNGLPSDPLSSTMSVKNPLIADVSADVSTQIETVSGRLVNVINPRAKDILLEDIAWATSRIPRFAGHTITQIPYNVAQHSVYVSELLEALLSSSREFNLDKETNAACVNIRQAGNIHQVLIKALLHDAHEAYTGDIPSPIKKIPQLRETFKQIEKKLDDAIRSHFCLSDTTEDEVVAIKYCDKLAQAIEGYQFMPSRGFNWTLPKPSLVQLQKFPEPKDAMSAYKDFIFRYEYLKDAK